MKIPIDDVLGRGVYGATEALRLINFQRTHTHRRQPKVSRNTIARWLYGYDRGGTRSEPLWHPDYTPTEDEAALEVSFRDLIELRFVKAFFVMRASACRPFGSASDARSKRFATSVRSQRCAFERTARPSS